MPRYQYLCTECGQDLEVTQSFSDDPLTECPTCTGRLRKVFSAVGVVFKGSGFYRNDSRSSKPGGASKTGETKVPVESSSSSETKSDSGSSDTKDSTPAPAPAPAAKPSSSGESAA